ncbi:hypothetical protein GXP67_27705 [Rhodocytophaga rosea]|uniref:Uncharacterized protein n=1 Tax=Rhodocytophaga rosea TaxID=2704465 RepID=A0A6C0GRP5_9BACT|nr:hypothetical protein [Rhodocytophaga rosea]QHT70160.1 hypothetical protein GXP67_27705 [Rhodocytophaga rosea]
METVINSYAMSLPGNFSLSEGSQEIIIEKRWFSIAHLGTLLFALLWNGFTFFFYSLMMSGNVSVIILLFPILHVMVGVWLMYYAICGFFNKTVIKASHQEISVRHVPLPWSGDKLIERACIEQLYILEQTKKHRGSIIYSYDVQVVVHNHSNVSLITGLDTPEEALYIEKKLEQFLRIEDRPVEGAYIAS